MTDFPPLLYPSTNEIPTLSYTWSLKKIPLLGGASPSHIFFRTAVLRKLFYIRFSYKHCNFSCVCLLLKMASKTVTRSIWRQIIFKRCSYFLIMNMTSEAFASLISLPITVHLCIGHIITSPQDYGTIYLIMSGELYPLTFLSQCQIFRSIWIDYWS